MFQEIKPTHEAIDTLMSASRGDMAIILEQIKNGVSQLWHTKDGYLVTRVEISNTFTLVIVLYAGKNARRIIEHLINFSLNNSIDLIRVHVVEKGIIKVFKRYGFLISEIRKKEIVMIKKIRG